MNDSGYIIAFNIMDSTDRQWWWPGAGLLLWCPVVLGIAIYCIIYQQKFGETAFFKFKVSFIAVSSACVLLSLVLATIANFKDYQKCFHALASGKASYVEGAVDNFVPMPYGGHANESFTVKGVTFSYSDFDGEAGFNNTSSHGGPIRQGLPVRVWYVGKEIVKLEIKK